MKTRTWIMAVACAAGLTGCAAPGTEPAAAPALTALDTYNLTITQVYGTPQQRQAATEAGWWRTQLAIRDCMADHGITYTPAAYQPIPDRGVAPGDLLAFAPARPDFGIAARLTSLAAIGETTQPALAANETAYRAASTACNTGELEDAGNPDGQEVLDGQLVATLTAVEKTALPTLAAQYKTCLASKGFTGVDNLSALYVKAEQKFPPVSFEHKSDPTTLPGWADAVAYEQAAASADAQCRADAVDTALVAAVPALATFATTNAAKLAAVAAGWQQAADALPALRAMR